MQNTEIEPSVFILISSTVFLDIKSGCGEQ